MLPLIATAVFALAQPSPVTACAIYQARYLPMPFGSFDQDLSGGGGGLDQDKCAEGIADLLAAYGRRHRPLTDRERSILSWREGQIRAMAGDQRRAIALMMGGVQDDGGEIDFADYALATIASCSTITRGCTRRERGWLRFQSRTGSRTQSR